MEYVQELAHAKINLSLDVLGKRLDGFHEVEMVMQTLNLADVVSIKKKDKGIQLITQSQEVPSGESNLAWKAAKLMMDKFNLTDGLEINLEKHIPVAAGLAGGSTDGAAVIRGINKLWNLHLTTAQLCDLGASIGSDVPFCILEGTAIARGRGELLEQIDSCPPMWLILVKPLVGVSTAQVYGQFKQEKVLKRPEISLLLKAISQKNVSLVADQLCNVLESVTIDLVPEIARIKERMVQAGAMNALMSGSGPTVFGIAKDRAQAELIAQKFNDQDYTIVVTQTY